MSYTKKIFMILFICICVLVYATMLWLANIAFGEFSESTT